MAAFVSRGPPRPGRKNAFQLGLHREVINKNEEIFQHPSCALLAQVALQISRGFFVYIVELLVLGSRRPQGLLRKAVRACKALSTSIVKILNFFTPVHPRLRIQYLQERRAKNFSWVGFWFKAAVSPLLPLCNFASTAGCRHFALLRTLAIFGLGG